MGLPVAGQRRVTDSPTSPRTVGVAHSGRAVTISEITKKSFKNSVFTKMEGQSKFKDFRLTSSSMIHIFNVTQEIYKTSY
jgi:hypothetical protein